MKQLLKAILPPSLLRAIRRQRRDMSMRRLHPDWDRAAARILGTAAPSPVRHLLILPSDPGGVVGAVGDDAMISAATGHFRTACPQLRVSILCHAQAGATVRALGAEPVRLPGILGFPGAMAEILAGGDYDALVCLGADVMDGYYSPDYSMQILVSADLAARRRMVSILLGFSFNANAAPVLAACFARLDPRVAVNLRDLISLERLRAFAPVPQARLVADSAFALAPGKADAATHSWITGERAAGRQVIGINLHPMLVKGASQAQIDSMVTEMSGAIAAASDAAPRSWLLLPHDYRDASGDGDGICLRLLQARLAARGDIRLRYFEGQHRADRLKALAGHLDAVVTGRMHLAIAALGMGIPVMCLTYQDKFEGLFRHFGLSDSLLLPPDTLEEPQALSKALAGFLADLPALAEIIARRKPAVLALAQGNFTVPEERSA